MNNKLINHMALTLNIKVEGIDIPIDMLKAGWISGENHIIYNTNFHISKNDWIALFFHELAHWTTITLNRLNISKYEEPEIRDTEEMTADVTALKLMKYFNIEINDKTLLKREYKQLHANLKKVEKDSEESFCFIIDLLSEFKSKKVT